MSDLTEDELERIRYWLGADDQVWIDLGMWTSGKIRPAIKLINKWIAAIVEYLND